MTQHCRYHTLNQFIAIKISIPLWIFGYLEEKKKQLIIPTQLVYCNEGIVLLWIFRYFKKEKAGSYSNTVYCNESINATLDFQILKKKKKESRQLFQHNQFTAMKASILFWTFRYFKKRERKKKLVQHFLFVVPYKVFTSWCCQLRPQGSWRLPIILFTNLLFT